MRGPGIHFHYGAAGKTGQIDHFTSKEVISRTLIYLFHSKKISIVK